MLYTEGAKYYDQLLRSTNTTFSLSLMTGNILKIGLLIGFAVTLVLVILDKRMDDCKLCLCVCVFLNKLYYVTICCVLALLLLQTICVSRQGPLLFKIFAHNRIFVRVQQPRICGYILSKKHSLLDEGEVIKMFFTPIGCFLLLIRG